MTDDLKKILKPNIQEDIFNNINNNYEKNKRKSLFELGVDSLAYLEILLLIEEKYNLNIAALSNFSTLEDMEREIDAKKNNK